MYLCYYFAKEAQGSALPGVRSHDLAYTRKLSLCAGHWRPSLRHRNLPYLRGAKFVRDSVFLFLKVEIKISPVGFTPEWKPRSGASREISAALARFAGAAFTAACWARRVVDTAGQPWPGPWRFCSVIRAAVMRALFEALELSVGNVTAIGGLLTACPAATLVFSA